jgi:hypothetical protein
MERRQRRRATTLTLLGVAAVTLALASSAAATIHVTAFTSRVATNGEASLTVKVTPVARCTIMVTYATVVSHAKGGPPEVVVERKVLGPKRGGTITWRWKVGSNTRHERWPVKIDCGKSGKLTRLLTVTG